MAMKSRIFSSLSAHKNFLGNIFFLEKLFVLDQPVKRYNQHPCLRLNNFVSILTYKNYLSFILKKDRRLIPTPLILPVPWLDFTLHGSLCATKNMAGKSV